MKASAQIQAQNQRSGQLPPRGRGVGEERTTTGVTIIYRRCLLEVQSVVFCANLMELSFREFDLILVMDWLVEHQVCLDCASKRVP
ncbi:Cadherin-related family member 4 [Gossypium australe]|uniref:Cadherin-related family member 4 n=1 Tax=Gossypium australe TaxID=47621 RepID=A0A5B6USJ8_9ROSI|nr:Cadherin-related family member 4 [Gossypium australe]